MAFRSRGAARRHRIRAGEGAPVKPRQHVLTIEGENNVTFAPAAGLNPYKVEYRARIEYLVKTRTGQELEADSKHDQQEEDPEQGRRGRRRRSRRQTPTTSRRPPSPPRLISRSMPPRWTSCRTARRWCSRRISRARFQGRFMPDAPVLSVAYREAPPMLQDLLKRFDVTAASVLLDDRARVLSDRFGSRARCTRSPRRSCRFTRRFPPTPPSGKPPLSSRWATIKPPRECSGFEKDKASAALPGGLVRVKVSGVLKAEGAIVGNLIKDGRYTVTGEQHYDPKSREWKKASWSVDVANDLANAAGVTVAHAKGKMMVDSKMLADAPAAGEQSGSDRKKS